MKHINISEYSSTFIEDSQRGLYRVRDFVFGEMMLLPAIRKQFNSANILEVTAATTGYRGGDAGHGCRTIVRIEDRGGTAIKARVIPESIRGNGGVELALAGDCELLTLVDGLRFAADALEKIAEEDRSRDAAV